MDLTPYRDPHTVLNIGEGFTATKNTLVIMARLARKYKASPVIRGLALRLFKDAGLAQKSYFLEAKILCDFVREKIRYMRDPVGVETVQTPETCLRLGAGDCDDKTTLLASLLLSVGHPVRFLIIGQKPNSFCHVYLETKIGNRWVPCETTEPVPFGHAIKNPASKAIFNF